VKQLRISDCGLRIETDRLRAINAPRRVEVDVNERGVPVVVKREVGNEKRVESIGEIWRIDDEWWRAPMHRRYVEAILEGGKRVVLFEDLVTGEWWIQNPSNF
jgi:hypothetical protein